MNYTITFNPAVDLVLQVEHLELGDLNRATSDHYVVGGKGINMSTILHELGASSVATGFVGGFSGDFIKNELEGAGIDQHFIEVDGITRINVKVKSDSETEINAAGHLVTQDKFDQLVSYLDQVLEAGDAVFLAGNAAPGLNKDHYQAIAKLAQEKEARFVLDSNKDLLTACLAYQPFLIKPNQHELGEIFQTKIDDLDQTIHYAKKLQEKGARNVIVSLGGAGSVLVSEAGQVYRANVPEGQVVNSVGAGDSMVAGFTQGFIDTEDYAFSLKQGAACGSATAYSVGIAQRSLIDQLLDEIKVEEI
ncbi:1-phosphofructokinase [Hutsoniella sourekii]|uniref:1-phosphofructokinase n=1 Tax=Hutsoniella sourekii TaxID=87650 RepID=UPI000481E20B|nr:1-phosphofructokinase [Hutsoniella sourekii]